MQTQTATQHKAQRSRRQTGGTPHNMAVGRYGEELASEYLLGRGYSILARNWRCAAGELDIVAKDGNTIVGIEVKTRTRKIHGAPYEAITWRKAARLRKLLAQWLRDHEAHAPLIRIDAVSIVLEPDATPAPGGRERQPEITHLRGVL